ncbi:MAG: hypothetical protein IKU61_02455 [Clostridia bacterium]|nr:hypothetical protein [Clostridia bacterium]
MKKFFICLALALLLTLTALAKSGDINGTIYETDITATINGVSVPSYNIGGRTVVIIEDITRAHYYNDSIRTLIVDGFDPATLIAGENSKTTANVGTKLGNTYETDIATYVYDKQITAYSLNGKMAVAIEDLGGDNTFNELGGKYVWNAENRTISLEFLHGGMTSIADIMHEKHVSLYVDNNYKGEFRPEPIMHASTYGITVVNAEVPKAITVEGRVIGYTFNPKRASIFVDDNGKASLNFERSYGIRYFYPDVVADVLKDVTPVQPTRADWLKHYETQMMTVLDSLETEEYTFVYLSQPNMHGATQFLRRLAADGSVICYEDNFKSVSLHGQKFFDNVTIDRENEKVTFSYDRIYKIDLKTGIME